MRALVSLVLLLLQVTVSLASRLVAGVAPALWPRYLVVFRAKFGPCRLEELRSALSAAVDENVPQWALNFEPAWGGPSRVVETCSDVGPPVFQYCSFPSAAVARTAARRCACVRAVLEVWAEGRTDAECADAAAQLSPQQVEALLSPMEDGGGWAVHFHSHGIGQKGGSGLSLQQRAARLEAFRRLLEPIPGPVLLAPRAPNRKHTLWLVDDYDPPVHSQGGAFKARGPSYVALGRLIAEGAAPEAHMSRLGARTALHITSLPADLSILLANCARVRPGQTVLDPFVGTGSTLIGAALVAGIQSAELARAAASAQRPLPAAVAGARTDAGSGGQAGAADAGAGPAPTGIRAIGLDIDECAASVAANFEQLGLLSSAAGNGLAVLRADIGTLRAGQPPLSELPMVDAIVCDPPYGIMIVQRGELASGTEAGMRRAAGAAGGEKAAAHELASLASLFELASEVLVPGGRLCFLLPAPVDIERAEDVLPVSASLALEKATRMAFTAKQSRWLVQMTRRGRTTAIRR